MSDPPCTDHEVCKLLFKFLAALAAEEDEDPRCPGCGEDKNEGSHGLGNGYGGCV